MKIKINVRGGLFILICILVTLANIAGFSLFENAPPFYQWSFYIVIVWYIWIMYKTLGAKAKSHNVLIRNICALAAIVLTGLIWIVSADSGMPLQLLTFLACILFLQVSMQNRFLETDFKMFLVIGTIGAVVFSWNFATSADIAYWYGVAFTLKGFNPQSVGCWACVYGMVSIQAIGYFRVRWPVKVMLAILCGYLFYITIATDTRAALVVLFLFLVLKCLPQIKILTNPWTTIVIAALPALVTFASILLFRSNMFSSYAGGSLLDGREFLWMNYLTLAMEHPLSGDYAGMEGVYTHNLFVEHALLFGYVLATLFIVLTALALSKAVLQIRSRKQYDAYLAFAGMLLLSSQENLVFSTGCGGMFVYAYAFLFMTTPNQSSQSRLKEAY